MTATVKFQTNGAIHRACDMHPNHAHRLLGVRHPLVHRQRDNKRSVPSGNRGNRGYSFRYPVLRLHSLVIHPLIPTDMAKRRSKTVEQQCRYYEVGNIFEYMVETYLNGNMSVFRGLYHELNKDARKDFIDFLLSEVEPIYWREILETYYLTTHKNDSDMKGTDHFKRTIQMYLEQRAEEDTLFAKNYRNPAKNIDDCVTYILNYVQKSGCNGFTDGEIYGQAVHYYDENEIEVGKPIQCQVAVNHIVELTAEEKAEARQQAVRRYQDEELRKLQNRTKPTKAKTETQVQPSLFDFGL